MEIPRNAFTFVSAGNARNCKLCLRIVADPEPSLCEAPDLGKVWLGAACFFCNARAKNRHLSFRRKGESKSINPFWIDQFVLDARLRGHYGIPLFSSATT
jgi:hypothetical protein